jgi:hypothetical protein
MLSQEGWLLVPLPPLHWAETQLLEPVHRGLVKEPANSQAAPPQSGDE